MAESKKLTAIQLANCFFEVKLPRRASAFATNSKLYHRIIYDSRRRVIRPELWKIYGFFQSYRLHIPLSLSNLNAMWGYSQREGVYARGCLQIGNAKLRPGHRSVTSVAV